MTGLALVGEREQQATEAPWYQAATLQERLAAFSETRADLPMLTDEQVQRGTRRLGQWKRQTAFQDLRLFQERLALDALTEQELLYLLAEPVEQVQQRLTTATGVPLWVQELLHALKSEQQNALSPLASEGDRSQGPVTFLTVFHSLIAPEWTRLRQQVEALATSAKPGPFDPATVLDLFQESLVQRLHKVALRTVILELHIARLEDRLSGDTPQERFIDFLKQLAQPERLRAFLQEYPVLARALLTQVHQWADVSLELLERLCADWSEICAQLTGGNDPGALVEVQSGAGDTHREGRSVTFLRFASGLQVVYKPRSLALDQHFQELLAWINAQQKTLPLRTLTILPHEHYGWIEFVDVYSCATEAEVARFYERQGLYLALLYVLEAMDFHYENILAAGEHPVLVDLEALFHPRFVAEEEPPTQSMSGSVLRTLLLPQRMYLQGEGEGLDMSGIGGRKGQMSPFPVLTWKEQGTDLMRATREHQALPGGQNQPQLQGQEVDVLRYESFFLQGFTQMYRLLMARRAELLTDLLPRFAQDDIRAILRPTRAYGLLLSESFHPEYLGNALERERLFDHLWDSVATQPHLRQAIPAEREDLLQGDIPLFTTQPGSRDGLSSRGDCIADLCVQPSMDSVSTRVRHLSEDDLARQLWIIRGSLTTLVTERTSIPRLSLVPSSAPEATAEHLVHAARRVGDRLKELAFPQKQGTTWFGIEFIRELNEKTIWNVQPLSPLKLYDGLPGVILFLSYLGNVTAEASYTDLAQTTLATVQESVETLLHPDLPTEAPPVNTYPLGAYEGFGSLIYLFTHLGVLWGDAAFIQKAEALVDVVDHCIAQDVRLDVTGGAAGGLASLLSLYEVVPAPHTLEVAIRCGEHLLVRLPGLLDEGKAQSGMAYGLAGMALHLLKLASVSQEERFRHGALTALTYERRLFDPEQGNWRRQLGQEEPDVAVAWCHGAPGIGLARLGALSTLDDAATHEEIALALETTRAQGFGLNHSLCHGDLGNLDMLLVASQLLEGASTRAEVARRTAMLLASIEQQGWCTGAPLGRETPGLMTGLAGIGYELLRLADPERLPSVLVLAPPWVPKTQEDH